MDLIDLRSDTVTKPVPAMRRAMAEAPVGDDVYGEDPTVNALEERVAGLLGKDAALWVPTGTMANQLAIGAHCGPGDEIVCERESHVVQYEGGGIGALWGAAQFFVEGPRGIFDVAALAAALRHGDDIHYPRQRAVAVENTHNRGGGSVWPLEQLRRVSQLARQEKLAVHLDGARLWNAHIATGVPLADWGACADTVSVALSKGLGAPAGSLVAGTRSTVAVMRRLRKRLGGGMRQVGILAAAGAWALDHHLARIADDHANARRLAQLLAELPGFSAQEPETNIVLVDVPVPAAQLVEAARAQGVLCNAFGARRVRLVLHLDVPAAAVPEAVARLRKAARA
jgi:threonine aldolase